MIPLDSARWTELQDAYGSAAGIPALLRQIETFPEEEKYDEEPWFSLWSALCHQGDVYSASFAAVPHILRVAESAPRRLSHSFFQLPACIEVARKKKTVDVPADLQESYFSALSRLPAIIGAAAAGNWDSGMLQSALAALAVVKGSPEVAEAALELDPPTAARFMAWFYEQ
jgi:hypothetical protein